MCFVLATSEQNHFHALLLQAVESVHADINLAVLKEASIIGMTTSGVAKHQKLITALGPKVSHV